MDSDLSNGQCYSPSRLKEQMEAARLLGILQQLFVKISVNQSATVITRGYESYRDLLKLAGWSFLYALVGVVHSGWLIRSNPRLRVSDNLRTDSHQNS